jgi:hypothetical protein
MSKTFRHGYFSLQPVFDYVAGVPGLPERDRSNQSIYGKYQIAAERLIADVPNLPGWYLWARPGDPKPEIYVGKSEEGLFNRFVNRFNQEYTVFWEAVHGPHPLIDDAYRMFPEPQYRQQIERYRCKVNATHVIWVATENPETDECEQVERELIQLFDTQPCNKMRGRPDGHFRDTALTVAAIIRDTIHDLTN